MWERVPKEMQDLQKQVKTCSWAACSTRCVATLTQPVRDTHVYPLYIDTHTSTCTHIQACLLCPYKTLLFTEEYSIYNTNQKKKSLQETFLIKKKRLLNQKEYGEATFPSFLFFSHISVMWYGRSVISWFKAFNEARWTINCLNVGEFLLKNRRVSRAGPQRWLWG